MGRTNSLTSARRRDGLGYIRIWATPPQRLVSWDGAPSPTKMMYANQNLLNLKTGAKASQSGYNESGALPDFLQQCIVDR